MKIDLKQKFSLRKGARGGNMISKLKDSKITGFLFASKKRRIITILLMIILITAVVLKGCGGNQKPGSISYEEAEVSRQNITQSLSGSGTLEPANSYTVTTLLEGDIISANFEKGDVVEKDTVLYQFDSSDASNNIEKAQISLNQAQRSYNSTVDGAYVKATVAGTIYSLDVKVGDEVTQGQAIATLRNSSTMTLKVPFPADDAKTFYVGQTATITLDSTFEKLSGTIKSISGSDIVSTGNSIVRNVTISVKNPGGLSSTQKATASVNGINCAGSGVFEYTTDSTITASSSGTVTAINKKEGSDVSKGAVIVTLGGDDLEEQIENASDSLKNSKLSMESTQDQLDNYTITSPIAGTIVEKQCKAGDSVESGTTLCTIYDLSYLEMTMSIDELDISEIEEGQTVSITADAVDGVYEGIITEVSVAGTTSNGVTSYPVTVRIDETDGLLPGMNVNAEIVLEEVDNALAVPIEAVERGDRVLITGNSPSAANAIEDQAPEGYVYVKVTTGLSNNTHFEITEGLQEGDTVAYIADTGSKDEAQDMMGMPGGGMQGGGEMPAGGAPSGGGGGMPSGGGAPGGGGGAPGGGF